jgi:hypothetical protein
MPTKAIDGSAAQFSSVLRYDAVPWQPPTLAFAFSATA